MRTINHVDVRDMAQQHLKKAEQAKITSDRILADTDLQALFDTEIDTKEEVEARIQKNQKKKLAGPSWMKFLGPP